MEGFSSNLNDTFTSTRGCAEPMYFPQHILPLLPLYNAQWWGYESLTAIVLVYVDFCNKSVSVSHTMCTCCLCLCFRPTPSATSGKRTRWLLTNRSSTSSAKTKTRNIYSVTLAPCSHWAVDSTHTKWYSNVIYGLLQRKKIKKKNYVGYCCLDLKSTDLLWAMLYEIHFFKMHYARIFNFGYKMWLVVFTNTDTAFIFHVICSSTNG